MLIVKIHFDYCKFFLLIFIYLFKKKIKNDLKNLNFKSIKYIFFINKFLNLRIFENLKI